jgi:hypothetical protein
MPNQIPAKVKNERHRMAMLVQQQIAHEIAAAKIGSRFAMPQVAPQTASIPAPLGEGSAADAIPMPLCWLLLAVSFIILVVQIWTYFS